MRIEINAGGMSGSTVDELIGNIGKFKQSAEGLLGCFKTVGKLTGELSGGEYALADAVENMSERAAEEVQKIENITETEEEIDSFLALVEAVDKAVAKIVDKNKDEFYKTTGWKEPHVFVGDDLKWYEKAWNWLYDTHEEVVTFRHKVFTAVKDTVVKVAKSIINYVKEHPWETLLMVATVIAGLLLPATLPFLIGLSALSGGLMTVAKYADEHGTLKGYNMMEFVKGAVVGAVTGLISGGLGKIFGNFITQHASGLFLNSASAFVRGLSGFVVGALSMAGSGIITRFCTVAITTKMETGSWDLLAAREAALDPSSILLDVAIGGSTGAAKGVKGDYAKGAPESKEANDSKHQDSKTAQGSNKDSSAGNYEWTDEDKKNFDDFLKKDLDYTPEEHVSGRKDWKQFEDKVGQYVPDGAVAQEHIPSDLGTQIPDYNVDHTEIFEAKSYSNLNNLERNIDSQVSKRITLATNGQPIKQTYYVNAVGKNFSIGEIADFYDKMLKKYPENFDIFFVWK